MKDDLIYYENNKKVSQKAVSNIKIIRSNEGYSYLELNQFWKKTSITKTAT